MNLKQIVGRGLAALAFALAGGLPAPATAQNCANFVDVPASSPFCANVEWLRNRAITLGCDASNYCPNAAVNRLAMAAFMNRLGEALTPAALGYDSTPGAIDLDAGIVACQTGDFTAAGFPRRAFVDASLSAVAPADAGIGIQLAVRVNGGAWETLNAMPSRLSLASGQWGLLSDLAAVDVDAGDVVRFGLVVDRGGLPGTASVASSRCKLRAMVYSRTGAASPF